jgi:hypothetical protein
MRAVAPFELPDLFLVQCDLEGGDGIVDVLHSRCSYHGRGDSRTAEQPCQRRLGRRDTSLLRNLGHAFRDLKILVLV